MNYLVTELKPKQTVSVCACENKIGGVITWLYSRKPFLKNYLCYPTAKKWAKIIDIHLFSALLGKYETNPYKHLMQVLDRKWIGCMQWFLS